MNVYLTLKSKTWGYIQNLRLHRAQALATRIQEHKWILDVTLFFEMSSFFPVFMTGQVMGQIRPICVAETPKTRPFASWKACLDHARWRRVIVLRKFPSLRLRPSFARGQKRLSRSLCVIPCISVDGKCRKLPAPEWEPNFVPRNR